MFTTWLLFGEEVVKRQVLKSRDGLKRQESCPPSSKRHKRLTFLPNFSQKQPRSHNGLGGDLNQFLRPNLRLGDTKQTGREEEREKVSLIED